MVGASREGFSLHDLLRELVTRSGSDLHLRVDSKPQVRVHGTLEPLDDYPVLSPEAVEGLAYEALDDSKRETFEQKMELDFSVGFEGLARFRVNLFRSKGTVGGVFRLIPHKILSFKQLGLPDILSDLCARPRGLVLITGPTGSGKSTTLAAMVDLINSTRAEHILTIEDPIEFVHSHKVSVVTQREVGVDTKSFADSLRAALRQDPDIVLVGEMRDTETIEMALRVAETGHLTFGTLHTNTAVSTINRIIDVFPAAQQSQIRTQLAMVLEGIVCQTLLPTTDGTGRVMAMEVVVPNPAIRNLIREDKIHQIYSVMQSGSDSLGTRTLNQSLAELVSTGRVAEEVALKKSQDKAELLDLLGVKSGARGSSEALPRIGGRPTIGRR